MWVRDSHGVQLDLATTPISRDPESTFVEFTAPTTSVELHGRAVLDDLAVFDLGATRRADLEWVSRLGDGLVVPDTPSPVATQVDVLDKYRRTALDFIVTRDGEQLDLTEALVTIDGSSLGPWNTPTSYKSRGHVNVPVRAKGSSTVSVFVPRQSSTHECKNCFDPVAVFTVDVGESKPSTVKFFYRQGTSKHMCTIRFPELETPGYRGDLARSVNFKSSGNSCKNDDAYWLTFENMPVGTELSVFDSPDGSRNDDFFIWETKAASSDLLYTDPRETPAGVTVQEQTYKNGLVGKVSRFELHYPGIW